MLTTLFCWFVFIYTCILISKQSSVYVWLISYAIFMAISIQAHMHAPICSILIFLILLINIFLAVSPLRQRFLSNFIFNKISDFVPNMSRTEREALEAGTVSWEGEIFRGSPDFKILHSQPPIKLSASEQKFLDGPVTELCRMLNDWQVTHEQLDLPVEAWQYIKDQGFLGMIIPKKYGGLEFSATAQMQVLVKLYSSSITAATTVAVPNSLGPGELLLKYGTQDQKDYYLPRLAAGQEVPCFALTGPNAGSDAAAIPDVGRVCYQEIEGEKILGISLTWDKRYITLCPVATVLGLAFRLFDPENILGKGEDIGISCALIPTNTKGVIRGRRHYPLNIPFMNGPTQGKDVFVPIDSLIGGVEMAGNGWRMLMECLSAGRAISLPSGACGASKAAALTSGAYSRIRTQFHTAIANFEGIEEPLARIAANTYIIDATLAKITTDIDNGARPSVASAIVKYHTTELSRQVACDAMDIHGGKGICLGPKNYLARGFQSSPISITVEGANILSRSLIIFGQGAIRCHPYIFAEMEALRSDNKQKFDKAFCGHFRFASANFLNSIICAFTDARLLRSSHGLLTRYYHLIKLYSVILSSFADLAMLLLGGKLKRKEKLSARLGDILSYLYQATSVLKKFNDDGSPEEDIVIVQWSCESLLYKCEVALHEIIVNFPIRWLRLILRFIYLPFGRIRKKPSDSLGRKVANLMSNPSAARTRLTKNIFVEDIENCPIGQVEAAFMQVVAAHDLEKIVVQAVKEGKITALTYMQQLEDAKQQKIINNKEYNQLVAAEKARQDIIAVDSFTKKELLRS